MVSLIDHPDIKYRHVWINYSHKPHELSSVSNNRTIDLLGSCEPNAIGFAGCECTDAISRINKGQIDCSLPNLCPEDCVVCQVCLYDIVEDCYNEY